MTTKMELEAAIAQQVPVRFIADLIPSSLGEFAITALDHLPFGINIINPAMEIMYINKQQQAFFPQRQLGGKLCYQAYTNDATREDLCPWCASKDAFTKGTAIKRLAPSRDENGQIFHHFEVVAIPLKKPDGEVFAVMELVNDISNSAFKAPVSTEPGQARNLSLMFDYNKMICASDAMRRVRRRMELISDTDVSVLILGETGTGKGMLAQQIHDNSNLRNKPFITLNCANLPESLFESELFGHERGAFTGATRSKRGLVEEADGGTLFLDEIGDAPLNIQAKLLRFLETSEFESVGGTRTKRVKVRIIAATNQDLDTRIQDGRFRDDLYYRLSVTSVILPPLRERTEEIPVLIEYFLTLISQKLGMEPKIIRPKVMRCMLDYDWPGNVRELKHEIEQMAILGKYDDAIGEDLLSAKILRAVKAEPLATPEDEQEIGPLKDMMDAIEGRYIRNALRRTNGNRSKAADLLGLSRRGLLKKMERYNID